MPDNVTLVVSQAETAQLVYIDTAAGPDMKRVDVDFQPGASAVQGDTLQFYVNGLGPVDNPTPSGEPAPVSPLSHTVSAPTVTIGGKNASVSFSGLTPTVVGLYAVNVTVPRDAPSGIQQLVISIGGVDSLPSKIAIR